MYQCTWLYFSLESEFCEHEWNKSSNPLAELEPLGKQQGATEAKKSLQSFLPIICVWQHSSENESVCYIGKPVSEHRVIQIFHLGNILLYLFVPHNQAIFKKLGSAFCQEEINNLHFFFPALERRFVSLTVQRMHRGFRSIRSWCLFALFQSLVILLDILQISHEISFRAHVRACSLPLQGLCSPGKSKNPLAKSWVTMQYLSTRPPPALGHWS